MLKQTVNYTDFDDNPAQDDLYFNLSKTEIMDNLDLKEQVEAIQKSFEGEQRELSTEEVRAILDLVKRLMCLAYGERSADGKRFIKNDEVWTNFTQSAAYDEYLFSLFEKPEKAYAFILGIMPKGLREEAQAMAQKSPNPGQELPPVPVAAPAPTHVPESDERLEKLLSDTESSVELQEIQNAQLQSISVEPGGPGEIVSVDDTPSWIREGRTPTVDEVRGATPEQMQLAFARKLQQEA